jgi:hypothetical protein
MIIGSPAEFAVIVANHSVIGESRHDTARSKALTPMMLPANRVMGDDGVYVSTRETYSAGNATAVPAMCGAPRVRRAIGSVDVKCVVSP